MNTRVKEYLL